MQHSDQLCPWDLAFATVFRKIKQIKEDRQVLTIAGDAIHLGVDLPEFLQHTIAV